MKITKSLLLAISLLSPLLYAEDNPYIEPEVPEERIRNEGDLNTNQINSNNGNRTTNNSGPNAGSRMPANTAVSPSLMSSGTESCLQSISGGLQLVGIGVSSGKYIQDEECTRS